MRARPAPLLATCTALLGGLGPLPADAQHIRVLVQRSPLAGFQYHGATIHWEALQEGDPLTLVREPDNPHDPRAVRVEWRGVMLGYLPRAENREVAREMDQGTPVSARIGQLSEDPNPWKRLRIDVLLGL
ncbi:HIRAN domain-containing protein [Zoogloea sp.]|uniref:HIRAN domain-containing protein n=1 Tax=Zoogloea sp. TaxID=49181 RepID=UPI001416C4A9|nr:MAG: HIRAN protein [Zoogloea sp.]